MKPAPPNTILRIALDVNKELTEDDRNRLLAYIPEMEWRAVIQLVLEHIESVTQYATDDGMAKEHGSLAFYSGGLAALRLLVASMVTYRDKGGQISEKS